MANFWTSIEALGEWLRKIDSSAHSTLGPRTALAVAVFLTFSNVKESVRILLESGSEGLLKEPTAV